MQTTEGCSFLNIMGMDYSRAKHNFYLISSCLAQDKLMLKVGFHCSNQELCSSDSRVVLELIKSSLCLTREQLFMPRLRNLTQDVKNIQDFLKEPSKKAVSYTHLTLPTTPYV